MRVDLETWTGRDDLDPDSPGLHSPPKKPTIGTLLPCAASTRNLNPWTLKPDAPEVAK